MYILLQLQYNSLYDYIFIAMHSCFYSSLPKICYCVCMQCLGIIFNNLTWKLLICSLCNNALRTARIDICYIRAALRCQTMCSVIRGSGVGGKLQLIYIRCEIIGPFNQINVTLHITIKYYLANTPDLRKEFSQKQI